MNVGENIFTAFCLQNAGADYKTNYVKRFCNKCMYDCIYYKILLTLQELILQGIKIRNVIFFNRYSLAK